MATTKIWPVKDSLTRVVDYAQNPDKTIYSDLRKVLHYAANEEKTVEGQERAMFVTGVNCNRDTAFQEMQAVKERFGKTGGNVAYHAYQSFKPDEVTPELCHQLGVELAKRMWGDEYQVLVATHFNTGTYHNHFVVNSVGLWDGRKFNCGKRAYYQFRQLSDDLCREYQLSTIKNPKGKTPRSIYFAEKRGEPTKYNLMREALDAALKVSVDGNCDPKSELYEKTSEYLRDQGYTVRVFNLVTPSASDSWNCLAEVGGQELMAQLFCDVIIKNTGGEERDHFWDSAEMNLLKALVLYVSTSYPKKKQNIGEVYQLIAASSEQELNALFGVLPVTHPAKAPYSIFKQASEGVRGGVIIGLGSRLQVFQNRDIRNITSYNEIDLELPGKQPCAYYCITSDQDSTFDFLSSLFLSFVFIRLVRYADEHCPGGELPVPVHVLGEELCACGVIPDLSRKISVIRSRNLSMSCVFQNLAGLQNRYPYNQWQEILGNCDVQLFLGCTDALTAEFISDRTGEASISVTSKAKQLGTWRVSNYTPEYRETSGVGRRKLMTMDEVLRMDIDKALILIRGKNVLEVDKYDYSKHPEAKKLRPSKAASHVPAWRANQPQEKQTPSAPPSQAAEKKPAQKKKPAPAEKVVAVTKESIMKKKEDT